MNSNHGTKYVQHLCISWTAHATCHNKPSSFQQKTAALDTICTASKATTTKHTVYKVTICEHLD